MMGAMSPNRPVRLTQLASQPLHNTANARLIEPLAAASLPPHTLMQRAGLAVARLACAIAPHAQTIWLACGPGNNGGDGLEAAMHLQHWGRNPVVTWLGDEYHCPPDALASLHRARAAGVTFAAVPPALCDLAIDALLGIGVTKPLSGVMATWLQHMHTHAVAVLCVDLPSGLDADTGCYAESEILAVNTTNNIASQVINTPATYRNKHPKEQLYCLALLTLKPGLFTAHGKDAAGHIWFDDLGASSAADSVAPTAWLLGADRASQPPRPHASHKGSFGDVAIIGGAPSMTGAALLAARAALHAGAGRVFVALLDGGSLAANLHVDPLQPELMFRQPDAVHVRDTTVVCGCGGGDAVRHVLPNILSTAPRLVLDADALNAIAQDTALQTQLINRAARADFSTILTPHPLEAARLLACSTAHVQSHRLQAAQQLADRFACTVVLKGAGSVIAAPDQTPCINASGNAKLATAGTGDVLAGVVGAVLAAGASAFSAACIAVYRHGAASDAWPADGILTASALAQRI